MTAITIRKLPEDAKQRLRMRAASHGRSMEAEARTILLAALEPSNRVDMTWIEKLIAIGNDLGPVELQIPDDEPGTPPDLSFLL